MALHSRYTEGVHEELDYLATWLPTVRLVPGDVCTLDDAQLQKVGTLAEFGIAFDTEDAPVETDIEYTSSNEVTVHVKAAGQVPVAGSALSLEDAGLTVDFAHAGAVLMRLGGCTSKQIRSLHAVGQQVLALHDLSRWPSGYVVVTEAVTAASTTIVISQGDGAGIDLVAKGDVQAGEVSLASIDAGVSVKREAKIGAKFIGAAGLTPLARVAGIKKRFLRADEFKMRSAPGADTADRDFASVGYGDRSDLAKVPA